MKKTMIIVAAGTLLLASCAKEYTCECEVTESESADGYSSETTFDYDQSIKAKEDDAKAACASLDYEESYNNGGINTTIEQECDFK